MLSLVLFFWIECHSLKSKAYFNSYRGVFQGFPNQVCNTICDTKHVSSSVINNFGKRSQDFEFTSHRNLSSQFHVFPINLCIHNTSVSHFLLSKNKYSFKIRSIIKIRQIHSNSSNNSNTSSMLF